jgi:hypothetical protein
MKLLQTLALTLLASLALTGSAVAEDVAKLLTDAQTAYLRGDVDTAKATFEMVRQLDPKNQTAVAFLRRIAVEEKNKGGAPAMEKQLSTVIIPKVEFRDASLREALEFLRKKVTEITDGKQAVNFVVQVPEENAAKVTVSLTNIPVTEVLRYMGGLAGVTFTYDQYAIVVRPAAGAAQAAKTDPQ